MAVKNRDKYAKAKKQFSPKYWTEITQEEATEAIKVFVPDYQGATIEVLDLATKTSPGATGTILLDEIESSAKLLAAKTRISGVVYTRMRIRTDGDYAYRRDAIERAADCYDCNKTKAVVSASDDVPKFI